MKAYISVLVWILLLEPGGAIAAKRCRIVVDATPFGSVEEAAAAENTVNWWDSDFEQDRACTEAFAATELASFLKGTGVCQDCDIEFLDPGALPAESEVFVLGAHAVRNTLTDYSLPRHELESPESFYICRFLDEGRHVAVIEGGGRVGTLYGVYRYLEMLGYRFFGPERFEITFYPEKTAFSDELTLVENPSYLTRGFHAWEERGSKDFFLWMARNHMNLWTSKEKEVGLLKKLGLKLADGGRDGAILPISGRGNGDLQGSQVLGMERRADQKLRRTLESQWTRTLRDVSYANQRRQLNLGNERLCPKGV